MKVGTPSLIDPEFPIRQELFQLRQRGLHLYLRSPDSLLSLPYRPAVIVAPAFFVLKSCER